LTEIVPWLVVRWRVDGWWVGERCGFVVARRSVVDGGITEVSRACAIHSAGPEMDETGVLGAGEVEGACGS
jgi:hypothetical protein